MLIWRTSDIANVTLVIFSLLEVKGRSLRSVFLSNLDINNIIYDLKSGWKLVEAWLVYVIIIRRVDGFDLGVFKVQTLAQE